ncbi:hypothetical protein ATG98_2322 [Marinobacter sp. LV10R520-4]|nr:hypothetical protein ATG98_2322 [Marinobacter sp. LV10R520-4]
MTILRLTSSNVSLIKLQFRYVESLTFMTVAFFTYRHELAVARELVFGVIPWFQFGYGGGISTLLSLKA